MDGVQLSQDTEPLQGDSLLFTTLVGVGNVWEQLTLSEWIDFEITGCSEGCLGRGEASCFSLGADMLGSTPKLQQTTRGWVSLMRC